MKTLSLCVVARNEEKNARVFIEHIKPFVNEIIFVDTGSSDKTLEIAAELGCKTFQLEQKQGWIEEARNFALSKASGDWILALDLDEIISVLDFGNIRKIIENPEYIGYYLIQRQYTNKIGTSGWKSSSEDSYPESKIASGWYENPILRLFINDARINYKGKPHDLVDESVRSIGKVCMTNIPLHHFGELNRSEAKADRNLAFLLEYSESSENKEKFYTLYQIACEYLAKNDFVNGELYLKKSLELNSDFSKSLRNLAAVYLKQKKLDEAEKLLLKVVDLEQNDEIYNNLGIIYSEKGEFNRAIKKFEKALELNPKSADSNYNLGVTYIKMRKNKKAVVFFQKAIELNPEYKKIIKI